ncbi:MULTISPECIES: ABC transporter ATP-binding protein [Paenibacillus]|uniref:ABC transporter ATP-binding protein n=1 Tax=Paenibacillus TaxID=44249 RepID=UPI000FD7D37A|nr:MULTISPECIES: ABC transporter ATP-binding protein [Paenibacillus]MBT2763312.1 ABC transporter ATP-binding protein [Paenibacillus sp. ISL-20]
MFYENVISLKNITKVYKMYNKPQDRLKQFLYRKKRDFFREFRALTDVSFEVSKGITLGIVGKNGSGKSTLLQIIAGTVSATEGEVNIKGRIAALLELGSGFNPEFTGRENVYLNGSIMGLSEREINDRMTQIEEFAEIGDFIDQPVKSYSSGMFVRLAFACAVNVDPDILIVDEALAVGDMQFQLKCIDKMKEFKKQGKTIIFVSHDTYSIKNFCDEVIWMKEGSIYRRGNVQVVTNEYENYMKDKDSIKIKEHKDEGIEKNVLEINTVRFKNNDGIIKHTFDMQELISVEIDYVLKKDMPGLVGGVAIIDQRDTYVCGINTKLDKYELPSSPGYYKLVCNYTNLRLLPGTYHIDIGFFESSGLVRLDYKTKFGSFDVISNVYNAEGIFLLEHNWSVGRTSNEI